MSKHKANEQHISVVKMKKSCVEVGELLKSLSHPQRLMILCHLRSGPKTVSQLQDLCEISQSQISQFLRRMKTEGLVECQRDGRSQFYSAADERVIKLISTLQDIYCH